MRVADRPAQNIQQSTVSIRQADREVRRPMATDARGSARLDSVAVGQYQLIVRAIGYGGARATVPVFPGCRTDVEVYLGIFAIGIAPPPPQRSMVRITTCRDER